MNVTADTIKRMTPDERAQLVALVSRMKPDLLSTAFPEQRAFIEDPARLKVAFCNRRAAKSYSAGLLLVRGALANPNTSSIYIAITREEARRIFWEPILMEIDRTFNLHADFNSSRLVMTLPNRSRIYLLGADSNEQEKRKMLGQKFVSAVIDESQDFLTNLHDLVYSVLKPAVADYRGTICLLGTPGMVCRGFFFELTTRTAKESAGWSVHEWMAAQNPHTAKQIAEEMAELRATHPGIDRTPSFRRNYLRQWAIDDDALVYRYQSPLNDYTTLPEFKSGWHHILGVDFGSKHSTAVTAGAWNDHDPCLYILEAFKAPGMDFTDTANKVKEWKAKYDVERIVVDGANLQGVEEIRRRHQLDLTTAAKQDKRIHIELMNEAFQLGRIKLNARLCAPLVDEYKTLTWYERGFADRKEHPTAANDAADSALYLATYAYNYLSEPEEKKPRAGTPDAARAEQLAMDAAADEEAKLSRENADEERRTFAVIPEDVFRQEW